jgi:hypothetical protein
LIVGSGIVGRRRGRSGEGVFWDSDLDDGFQWWSVNGEHVVGRWCARKRRGRQRGGSFDPDLPGRARGEDSLVLASDESGEGHDVSCLFGVNGEEEGRAEWFGSIRVSVPRVERMKDGDDGVVSVDDDDGLCNQWRAKED